MRKGTNPEKDNQQLRPVAKHRIILPVYIPSLDGYFEHLLEIVELSLESLWLSVDGKSCYITVVSNGCCTDALSKLNEWYDKGWFNQLIINRENLGKVDGTLSIARGSAEEFITISDCDVLFKPGWLEAVERIFATFPEAGFVSPTPAPHLAWNYTSATILGAVLRRELYFGRYVNEKDMRQFAESVGTPSFVLEKQFVVRRGIAMACVGAGHFVFTIRRRVVEGMPKGISRTTLSSDADRNWFDIPPDRMGYWRLSALKTFAYHLGNTPEAWMYDEIDKYRRTSCADIFSEEAKPRQDIIRVIPFPLRQRVASFIRKPNIISKLVRSQY